MMQLVAIVQPQQYHLLAQEPSNMAEQFHAARQNFFALGPSHAGGSMVAHQPCLGPQAHLEPVRGLLCGFHSAAVASGIHTWQRALQVTICQDASVPTLLQLSWQPVCCWFHPNGLHCQVNTHFLAITKLQVQWPVAFTAVDCVCRL
eukprot:GHRR01019732.1.p1 GENE.GHRR01019732.1~~GHRR01019732.1.p1  ORF type:complete len:147 (-),score=36.50 GHRR01019732.1:78-518(-)